MLLTPNKIPISWKIKTILGCTSKKPVIHEGKIVKIRNMTLCYHDLYHLEVAQLERIHIGKYFVSGIHGINSSMFHELSIIAEYDGILDEVRVAFHELLVKTSVYNFFKAIAWMVWLAANGINPILVVWQHYVSLKRFLNKNLYRNVNIEHLN